jgi:hypothetical protein
MTEAEKAADQFLSPLLGGDDPGTWYPDLAAWAPSTRGRRSIRENRADMAE